MPAHTPTSSPSNPVKRAMPFHLLMIRNEIGDPVSATESAAKTLCEHLGARFTSKFFQELPLDRPQVPPDADDRMKKKIEARIEKLMANQIFRDAFVATEIPALFAQGGFDLVILVVDGRKVEGTSPMTSVTHKNIAPILAAIRRRSPDVPVACITIDPKHKERSSLQNLDLKGGAVMGLPERDMKLATYLGISQLINHFAPKNFRLPPEEMKQLARRLSGEGRLVVADAPAGAIKDSFGNLIVPPTDVAETAAPPTSIARVRSLEGAEFRRLLLEELRHPEVAREIMSIVRATIARGEAVLPETSPLSSLLSDPTPIVKVAGALIETPRDKASKDARGESAVFGLGEDASPPRGQPNAN